jgi:NAD+ synthase (glutamine-hydrolysing)
MYKHNFVKVGMVVPKIKLGDAYSNALEIVKIIEKDELNAILVFPELTITGYSLGDWIFNRQIINEANNALQYILDNNNQHLVILGSILELNGALYNVAYVIQGNKILGIIPKTNLVRNNEFNDPRYFTSGEEFIENMRIITVLGQDVPIGSMIFTSDDKNVSFGVEVCADAWGVTPLNSLLYKNGAEIVFNCSASTYNVGKDLQREILCSSASLRGKGAYVYTSTGVTETSSDVMYSGHRIASVLGKDIYNSESLDTYYSSVKYCDIDLEKIKYNRVTSGWMTDNDLFEVEFNLPVSDEYKLVSYIDKEPFITSDDESEKILKIVSNSLYNRLTYSKAKGLVIGISGGLDSTLALLMSVYMCDRFNLDRKIVHAITMPALATSEESKIRALNLMKKLSVDCHTIDVNEEVVHHLGLIGHDGVTKDIAYENTQARYRTLVLMNFANANSSLVVGTGDMSEIALGFATFNGDHMSMYNINAGIPKTAIRHLTKYFINHYPEITEELMNVVNAMISPELVSSSQSTEDFLGKYEINDFILHELLANGSSKERLVFLLKELFELEEVDAEMYYDRFLRRFKSQQYKRLASPEGIKIFDVALSPRGEFKMPGDLH